MHENKFNYELATKTLLDKADKSIVNLYFGLHNDLNILNIKLGKLIAQKKIESDQYMIPDRIISFKLLENKKIELCNIIENNKKIFTRASEDIKKCRDDALRILRYKN